MTSYDLAIIGSGPAGYVAALYAARHKMKVAVIEASRLGGTCLNRGCIPTKALLQSASVLTTIREAGRFGIEAGIGRPDFNKISTRKDEVVTRLRSGLETLFKSNHIEFLSGRASITAPDEVVIGSSGSIKAKYIIIATGSKPSIVKGIDVDGKTIMTSDDILGIKEIPESLAIVGGGVIGCEFAHLFNVLGSRVSIIEYTDRLIPALSKEASRKLETAFRKRGVRIFTSVSAKSLVKSGGLTIVGLSSGAEVMTEKILVSAGRSPDTDMPGLKDIGIALDGKGRIAVNDRLEAKGHNIFAIGDCVSGPQLAHKASYDAFIAVDNIAGKDRRPDYSVIPNCIWTEPEIAAIGINDEEAKTHGPNARIVKFPYLASGKAYIKGRTDGYVKIIGDSDGRLLGAEIFGEGACEMISEIALAKSQGIRIGQWVHAVHAHPTISETVQEALHLFLGTPIHST